MTLLRKKIIWFISSIIILIGLLALLLFSLLHTSLDELNGEGYIEDIYVSTNNKYQAVTYVWSEGGATVGFSQRVGINSVHDYGVEFSDQTIYWQYPAGDPLAVKWKDDNTIIINNILNFRRVKLANKP
ncbi:DUF5412 family protein [Bacillus niameyensis]|uniref:DUF5412 family protein n=1 Tax=Bacillus niameyensis TaxID=1522308 RepID=UPI000783B810|nr:DUF5412 family protein [Bacillus niameyensis]